MTIIFFTEYFPNRTSVAFTGGVESRVYHLVEFLKEKHSVIVIKRTDHYEFGSLFTSVKRVIFFFHQILRITIFPIHADIVEGTNFLTYILAFVLAKRVGAKSSAWYPDVFIGTSISRLGLASGILVEIAEKISLRLPWDGVIALSKETKKKLILNHIHSQHLLVIYGGTDPQGYRLRTRSTQEGKFDVPTLLCISRLIRYKRVEDLLLGVYLLAETIPKLRVVIVGNGPEKRNLKRLSRQLNLSKRTEWLNGVPEDQKQILLCRSHLHVLPSIVEGFGLVTIESLSSGTPVVNVDTPINREILDGECGGLLYPLGDYVSLADAVATLLSDATLYNQKIKEGRSLVTRYEWKKINSQTEAFYQRLLSH